MAYLSLYRKWRPQDFSEVVGQEHIVHTITNALKTGRVAHAYLFAGPRGTGKTTFARLLAKGLNCSQGPTGSPCNNCDNCNRITRGVSVDVIEIDGASNRGIDEIRELRDRVKYAPTEGRYKVYIIDEVHMLTNEAFNALLKVLEEPPAHVIFVFATTEAHKVPATILSRCQKFDFRRFSAHQLTSQLEKVAASEGVVAEPQAIALIAKHAEGGMRDALAILDQCLAASAKELTVGHVSEVLGVVRREALHEMAGFVISGDLPGCLRLVHALMDEGIESRQLLKDMASYFRDLVLLRTAPDVHELVASEGPDRARMQEQAERAPIEQLLGIVEILAGSEAEMRWATNPAMAAEITLVKASYVRNYHSAETQPVVAPDLSSLEQRLHHLEDSIRRLQARVTTPAEGTRTPEPEPKTSDVPLPSQPSIQETPDLLEKHHETTVPSKAVVDQPTSSTENNGSDTDTLSKLQTLWPTVLNTLKEERLISVEAFLRVGTPGEVRGRTVVIYFSPGHKFHQASIENAKNKSAIERVISRILGLEVVVSTAIGSPPSPPRAPEDSDRSQRKDQPDVETPEMAASMDTGEAVTDVVQSPAVQKALRYLGGRVSDIQES